MSSNSFTEFDSLLGTVDQLIDIHGRLQQGRGRRHQQDAIHRAGVVLTVAAWQAYIEKVIGEGFSRLDDKVTAPLNGVDPPPWAVGGIRLRGAMIKKRIADFNTPNSENVRRLFVEAFDFNPWPYWTWHVARRDWNSAMVRDRTNEWLRIRHSIAHGFELPDDLDWIQGDNGSPRLTLNLLKECRKHFHYLASMTDDAFWTHLYEQYGISVEE